MPRTDTLDNIRNLMLQDKFDKINEDTLYLTNAIGGTSYKWNRHTRQKPNSIDRSIEEAINTGIRHWLDENLSSIVTKEVEAIIKKLIKKDV